MSTTLNLSSSLHKINTAFHDNKRNVRQDVKSPTEISYNLSSQLSTTVSGTNRPHSRNKSYSTETAENGSLTKSTRESVNVNPRSSPQIPIAQGARTRRHSTQDSIFSDSKLIQSTKERENEVLMVPESKRKGSLGSTIVRRFSSRKQQLKPSSVANQQSSQAEIKTNNSVFRQIRI
ncbi:hypothetical protein HK096_009461 [Nowakowskiella sp. JEL0078]|nr:hypothetical protein HK096_009461 [Nowakowskiella sp. JEL0078]